MFKLENATISDMQRAVEAGELTYKELTLMYMEQIAAKDSCENGLNSVAELNPDALTGASIWDDNQEIRGPLYGISVLLKDNIATKDAMRTTAGSLALMENYASQDATIVTALRESGAIILGKTNMTEFANWMTDNMPNGYSSRSGRVKNPHNPEADPYGSSTGSAVAVAANLCAASIGTETHGSIIAPAFANGVVGIKPTAGLFSTMGIVPISYTLDTPGPMARTVYDAALILGALRPHYSNTKKIDYTGGLNEAKLQGLRIGIYNKAGKDEEYNKILNTALRALEEGGAVLIHDLPLAVEGSPWQHIGTTIAHHEFRNAINQYLSGVDNFVNSNLKVKNLADIIEFNRQNPDSCLKYGQTTLEKCQAYSDNLTAPEYIEALRRRQNACNALDAIFDNNNLDVIICANEFDGIAPITGFPSGTIPIGRRENNVPAGMYFMARRNDETTLIRAMHACEQAVGRKP